ncbi:MAG: hypothetical protein ACREDM_16365 [Methylocella sp.]
MAAGKLLNFRKIAASGECKSRMSPSPALKPAKDRSLTGLKEKLIKIDAKVVSHRRYVSSGVCGLKRSQV